MTRLVLVRHASTDWSGTRFCGRTDPSVNETGRGEIVALVGRLTAMRLSVSTVRSSPSRRAVETAGPLASALGAHLELDDRLREVDFGRIEGCTFDDVARSWPGIARSLLAGLRHIDWPEGELAAELATRCRLVARELETAAGEAVVVTHGGPIRALVSLLGIRAGRVDVRPSGLMVLERGATWSVVELDESAGAHAGSTR